MESRCTRCEAEVICTRTIRGEDIELDTSPHPDGDVAIMPAGAMILPVETVLLGKKIGSKRYVIHVCKKPDRPMTLSECKLALEESVKLQSHYADLLNRYDGGKRVGFATADEWVARLKEVGKLPS